MRGNIIEEMYYGNIDPQDHSYCPKSTVKKASDSLNDLEIIEAAAIGIAMGNGREELKAAADYVTTDIGDDGIWNACVHFGLF